MTQFSPLHRLGLATVASFGLAITITATQRTVQAATHRTPLAQLKLGTSESPKPGNSGRRERLLGLTPYGTAIILSEKKDTGNNGDIIQWSVSKRQVSSKTPLTKWIDAYDLKLSSDGRLLVSNNQRSSLFFPQVRTYRTTILRSSDLTVFKSITSKPNEYSVGFVFPLGDEQHVLDKRSSIVGYGKSAYFTGDRFEWLNLSTGKVDRKLFYQPGRGCDKAVLSPDNKYLACLFTDEHFDLIDNKSERSGIVDILDARTGKIVWHIQGTAKNPAGDPLFFISPTQFISSDTIFNIATKTARPWGAITPSTRCLAVVPGHSSYALFFSKQGLQLRDWRRGRIVASWPTLKTQGRVFFAPDLKMFAYKRGPSVQFWRFDPSWLR